MSDSSKSRVYVLGAGCSYDKEHGYPLAKDFVPALQAYAAKIAGAADCQRIKNAAENTAALLAQCQTGACHAATIDQLINLIWSSRCDDEIRALNPKVASDRVALRYDAVRKAKVATAACFLDREGPALRVQIGKYRDFIQRKVLDETGLSVPCQSRLQRSTARVLTLNYDRLFELAFYGAFADDYLKRFSPYQAEALNCGMTAFGEIGEFAKGRFCFVKLHGSSGMLCSEDPWGQKASSIRNVADWRDESVNDALFFPDKQPRFTIEPMIVFPYEKDYIMNGRENRLPFRSYIEKAWAHAACVVQGASELWVIGYSFDPTDCRYLIDLMRKATACERMVIQNLPAECDRLEALLKVEYRLEIPIEKYPVPF